MSRKQPGITHYGSCCGAPLEYVGYYRCGGCGKYTEMREIISSVDAAYIRTARAGQAERAAAEQAEQVPGVVCDALF